MAACVACHPSAGRGRGAAGEDISIVRAGLVSCPSDIHYLATLWMMDNPSEHQLCDDTLESLGNINLSVFPRKEENSLLLLGAELRGQCLGQRSLVTVSRALVAILGI